ncbi:ribosomal protein L13 domain-containing protein [Geranomyces variabilis]|nr:ribosomal protein L13 domain-containing protein [Geranomyces variabilis]KAJ3138997.1 54S ribosomal protein L23, mitochondrial [Geranomyces variabilis]
MLNKTGLAYGRVWHLVDAKDKVLGKLAQRVGIALRGKYKPTFNPAVDTGDYVVVVNARHMALTGKKASQKKYWWHSGYPGGVTELKYNDFVEEHPTAPLKKAVYGMLPKNNLRKAQMSRLLIFADSDHPYEANILRSYEGAAAAAAQAEASSSASLAETLPSNEPPPTPAEVQKLAEQLKGMKTTTTTTSA